MSDDFVEDQPYILNPDNPDDLRRYYRNRPLARLAADSAQEHWPDDIHTVSVELEPGKGFVAVVHAKANIPDAWQEGYEVRTNWQPEKTPSAWVGGDTSGKNETKSETASATPSAPKGGATARVWAIADELATSRSDRGAVIAKCIEEGINKSTAATQWSKWAKAKGL